MSRDASPAQSRFWDKAKLAQVNYGQIRGRILDLSTLHAGMTFCDVTNNTETVERHNAKSHRG